MARGTHLWFNGKIMKVEETKISPFTHALHYGTGAFEGIRAYKQKRGGGAVFRLPDHMKRLHESFKILGFKIPFSVDDLIRGGVEACKANDFEECYLRPIAFLGDGPLGVDPGDNPPVDVAILIWEWGNYLGDQGANEGARLKISSFVRPHVNSLMTKGKISGQYVNSVLAKREAKSMGFDEALLLDPEGYLTEGSGENLFIVIDGIVKTTPLTSILAGITRRTVLNYLQTKKIPVVEARFTRDELWCADEIFLTGTAAEITPIKEVDLRPIGKPGATVGPITAQVKKDYQAIVRGELELPGSANWLTPIR